MKENEIISYDYTEYVIEYEWNSTHERNIERYSNFDDAFYRIRWIHLHQGEVIYFYKNYKEFYKIGEITG